MSIFMVNEALEICGECRGVEMGRRVRGGESRGRYLCAQCVTRSAPRAEEDTGGVQAKLPTGLSVERERGGGERGDLGGERGMKAHRAATDAGATLGELDAAQTHTGCATRRHSPLRTRKTGVVQVVQI